MATTTPAQGDSLTEAVPHDAHWSSKNPGLADQYRAEALAARRALGFAQDSDEVAPVDISERIEALRATPQVPAQAVPEGWALVPVEPTKEAVQEGYHAALACIHDDINRIVVDSHIGQSVWSEMIRTMSAAAPPVPAPSAWRPTHQHRKGGLYRVITRGELETDLSSVVIYESVEGRVWVRPAAEFDDGRFMPLPPAPAPASTDDKTNAEIVNDAGYASGIHTDLEIAKRIAFARHKAAMSSIGHPGDPDAETHWKWLVDNHPRDAVEFLSGLLKSRTPTASTDDLTVAKRIAWAHWAYWNRVPDNITDADGLWNALSRYECNGHLAAARAARGEG